MKGSSNTTIEFGGMMGESILEIPTKHKVLAETGIRNTDA
jgi:hypothetical protein